MRRVLLVCALVLAFCCASFSQSTSDAPASKEDIERYLETMHSHEMMKQMIAAMSKPMHQMVHDQYIKDKGKLPENFEATMNKSMDEMTAEMPFDEMMDAMVPTYQKHLTKGDVDSLVAFYSSPTGQKLLREMPAMMGEAMEAMVPVLRKSMDKVQERTQQQIAQMMKDYQKKSADSAVPAQN